MSELKPQVTTFVLDEERSAKVDAIAAHLRAELGVRVSRSEAMRVLIDRFSVPGWSFNRPENIEVINPAA